MGGEKGGGGKKFWGAIGEFGGGTGEKRCLEFLVPTRGVHAGEKRRPQGGCSCKKQGGARKTTVLGVEAGVNPAKVFKFFGGELLH